MRRFAANWPPATIPVPSLWRVTTAHNGPLPSFFRLDAVLRDEITRDSRLAG